MFALLSTKESMSVTKFQSKNVEIEKSKHYQLLNILNEEVISYYILNYI